MLNLDPTCDISLSTGLVIGGWRALAVLRFGILMWQRFKRR
jgi:hypothetical protein